MDQYENSGEQTRRDSGTGGRHSTHDVGRHSSSGGGQGNGKFVKLLPYIVAGIAALVVVAVLLVLLLGGGGGKKSGLEGLWTVDGVTSYRFERGGKGAMELPDRDFAFTYTVENGVLSIDFKDEMATDAQYSYSVSDDTLVLTGIKVNDYDEDVRITFTKVED